MLSHENISQRIFEYHEGILDASQESELMEYLHQHPELNHEFAVWAQARLHDEPVEKPVFYKKLLKEKPFYYNWPAFTRLSFEIVTLCSLTFLLNTKPNYNNETKNFREIPVETRNPIANTTTPVPEKQPENNQTTNQFFQTNKKPDIELITEAPTTKEEVTAEVQDSLPALTELSAVSAMPAEIDEPDITLYEPTEKVPQATAEKEAHATPVKEPQETIAKVKEKEKAPVKKVNRKKYYTKQKFSLRPTSKIVPQNKDF